MRKEISSSAKEQSGSIERKRGSYKKIAPAKKAKIAKYAAENDIAAAAAIRHFKTKEEYSQIDLKESTVGDGRSSTAIHSVAKVGWEMTNR